MIAGVRGDTLMLGDATKQLPAVVSSHAVLMLVGRPAGRAVELTLSVVDPATGAVVGALAGSFPPARLTGNTALASQFAGPSGLPDDHDEFHGNVWGEAGAPYNHDVPGPSAGGYRQPVAMVNVVHKTNCSHHPDFASPKPCKQGISVYYGDMVYSGFGVATIDPAAKTYTMDCYRFLCDAMDGRADNQFPGWPLTIHQAENRGENRLEA